MPDAESVYLFRHALVRDAAYGLFPPAERVGLHRAAIGSYEALFAQGLDTHAEELLQHSRAALAQDAGGSTTPLHEIEHRYLRLSADFCARGWRVGDELGYLEQLETHPLSADDERAVYMLRRASHMQQAGRLDLAESLAVEAARLGDRDTRLQALHMRFMARDTAGRVNGTTELDELLQELAEAPPCATLVGALISRATAHSRAAEHESANDLFDKAVAAAHALRHPEAEAEALFERGLAHHRAGRSDEGFRSVSQALGIARAVGNKQLEMNALNRLGIIHVETGRLEEAAASYQAARDIAHAIGAKSTEATISNNYANLHFFFFGNLSIAERVYLESLEFFREHNEVHSIAHANGVLGLMYHAAGEYDKGRRCFETVREFARMQDDRVTEAKAWMGLAFCADNWEDISAVMDGYRAAIEHLRAAPSGATLSRTWGTMGNHLLKHGYTLAAGEALRIAVSQHEVEGFRSTIVAGLKRRHELLVGDRAAVDPAQMRAAMDTHALDRVSFSLTDQFIYEAGEGADPARLRQLGHEIARLAGTFEALRYERVRFALRLVDATLEARDDQPRWRGLALNGLPKGLATSLANPGKPQPSLSELMPGLDKLSPPLPVK